MFLISKLYGQVGKIPEDFGYRHVAFKYQSDPVDVIIISKKGDEKLPKPLFLFCQGSLPQPVIKYDEHGSFGVLPFDQNLFLDQFHIVIVGKPFVPVISHASKLGRDFMFLRDYKNEIPPKGYIERNYLDYYVYRNNFIIKQLFKERWVRASGLVVAGHSEGSTIAARMASTNRKVTKLIYVSGNPYGRIASIAAQESADEIIDYWKAVVAGKSSTNPLAGDSPKATYSFSLPQRNNLMDLRIPVLICYGSEDIAATYLQLFQIEVIREEIGHINFRRYEGCDHNFFSDNGAQYHWNEVAGTWAEWISR